MPRSDKRQQIMDAAEKLFTSKRFHEITLDDVIRVAGVGKGTVYRYFQGKDDLFFQTAVSGFEALHELLGRTVPTDSPFDMQLLAVCREISSFFERRRPLFRMMQSEAMRVRWQDEAVRTRWRAGRRKLLAAVTEIVARGVAEGKVRQDIPPDTLAHFLLGMLRARSGEMSEMPRGRRGHELLVDLFCNGAALAAARRDNRRRRPTVAAKR